MGHGTPHRVAEELEREAAEPGELDDLATLLIALGRCSADEVTELLRVKQEQLRAGWFLEGEVLWLRKWTWRLTRPLLVVGVLGAVASVLQKAIDPTLALTLFLAGAAGFYVAVQLFAHHWARVDRRRKADVDRRYAEAVRRIAARAGS